MIYLDNDEYKQHDTHGEHIRYTMNSIMHVAATTECCYFLLPFKKYLFLLKCFNEKHHNFYIGLPTTEGVSDNGSPFIRIAGITIEAAMKERVDKINLLK